MVKEMKKVEEIANENVRRTTKLQLIISESEQEMSKLNATNTRLQVKCNSLESEIKIAVIEKARIKEKMRKLTENVLEIKTQREEIIKISEHNTEKIEKVVKENKRDGITKIELEERLTKFLAADIRATLSESQANFRISQRVVEEFSKEAMTWLCKNESQ